MLAALKQFFMSSDGMQRQAYEAYVALVAQARKDVFYQQWQVEDSLDGRFDCIVLHLCLLLQRLDADMQRPDVANFIRFITEAFFADMDRSLREMGVGDTGIGIRVKKMAQAFYGRKKAYADAMGDETTLAEALVRNAYREKEVLPQCVASLAAYMGRNARALELQSVDAILQGHVGFTS